MLLHTPISGDMRVKHKFAFFPIKIDDRTRVWLGFCYLAQLYTVSEWMTKKAFLREEEAKTYLKTLKSEEERGKIKYRIGER